MDIILFPDAIFQHYSNLKKKSTTVTSNALHNIINNVNNKFVINKALLEMYEEQFIEDSTLADWFRQEANQIINSKAISIKVENQTDEINLIKYMYDKHSDSNNEKIIPIISVEDKKIQSYKTYAYLNNFNPKNIDWLLCSLAGYNPMPITYRYFDFQNNNDIKNLFKAIFSLNNKFESVSIFDRQTNINHDYFNHICQTKKIDYYTTTIRNIVDRIEINKTLKKKFNSLKIYRIDRDLIHERKIIYGELIIETDEDFWNLEVERQTWKIDILVCKTTLREIKLKMLKFKRDNS